MIGIISDIHGNYVALASVLDRLDRLGAGEIICLGDVAGYYCQVNECCEALRARKIFTLMGNHDWYLAAGQPCPRSKSANVCLDYQRGVISKENLNWLAGLPARATLGGLNLVHGGWNDPMDEYVEPTAEYFSGLAGRHFASGHTHLARVWTGGGEGLLQSGGGGAAAGRESGGGVCHVGWRFVWAGAGAL